MNISTHPRSCAFFYLPWGSLYNIHNSHLHTPVLPIPAHFTIYRTSSRITYKEAQQFLYGAISETVIQVSAKFADLVFGV